jgi:hypothetical protein
LIRVSRGFNIGDASPLLRKRAEERERSGKQALYILVLFW